MLVLLNSWVLSARGSVIVWHCPRSCWGRIYTSRSPAFLKEEQWDVRCACWPARLLRRHLWEDFGWFWARSALLPLLEGAEWQWLNGPVWTHLSWDLCLPSVVPYRMNALKTVVRQMRILSLWTALLLPPLGAEMLKVAQRHSVYRVIPQYSSLLCGI